MLYTILDGLLRLLSPILCFTAEEAWNHLHSVGQKDPLSSGIFFTEFPSACVVEGCDEKMMEKWELLIKVRSEITRALELARQEKVIGHSLEAEVLVKAEGEIAAFLEAEWDTVKQISIISELNHLTETIQEDGIHFQSEEISGFVIQVQAAEGGKCDRCWIRSTSVGNNETHPEICDRCCDVVAETIS